MFKAMSEQYQTYLRDESRLTGQADSIIFPANLQDLQAAVRQCLEEGAPITVQGSRTGICGGAVPMEGRIINLSEMAAPLSLESGEDGFFYLKVQPGYLLSSLRRDLRRRRFDWLDPAQADTAAARVFSQSAETFWPPDPSELTASIGGIASTNARGPAAFKYGSAGQHIEALEAIMPEGELYTITRDRPEGMVGNIDLMQALLGGEGMYGIIASLTLRLLPKPSEMWGISFFFDDENNAAYFIDQVLTLDIPALAALDFLDKESMALAVSLKEQAAKLREIPDPPAAAAAAVYLELYAYSEEELEAAAEMLMEAAAENGSDPDDSWALSGDDIEKLRLFRHAVPEAANTRLDKLRLVLPAATKLGGDLTLPGYSFQKALSFYRESLKEAGVKAAVFGHCGEKHLHVNLFPEDARQREAALGLMRKWLAESRRQNGFMFREHGIGKTKKEFFQDLEDPQAVEIKRGIKKSLDPKNLFNPGNMF